MTTYYRELANAIIVQAVDDYKRCQKKLRKKPENQEALMELRQIEKFFYSEWYKFLTDIEPERLIRRLEEDNEQEPGTRKHKKSSNKKGTAKGKAGRID